MDWNQIRKRVAELRYVADKLEAMIPHEEDVILDDIEVVAIEAPTVIDFKSFRDEIAIAINTSLREVGR